MNAPNRPNRQTTASAAGQGLAAFIMWVIVSASSADLSAAEAVGATGGLGVFLGFVLSSWSQDRESG